MTRTALVIVATLAALALVGTLTVSPSWPVVVALAVLAALAGALATLSFLASEALAVRAHEHRHDAATVARLDAAFALLATEHADVLKRLADAERVVNSHETALRNQNKTGPLRSA